MLRAVEHGWVTDRDSEARLTHRPGSSENQKRKEISLEQF